MPKEIAPSIAEDVRVAVFGTLLPLGLGLLLLDGWILGDWWGAALAAWAAAVWVRWWRTKRGALFPRDIQPSTLAALGTLVLPLGLVTVATVLR